MYVTVIPGQGYLTFDESWVSYLPLTYLYVLFQLEMLFTVVTFQIAFLVTETER